MDNLTEKMDYILTTIDQNRWISFSKDDSPETFKAKDKLRAFGLIERHGKYSWQLTEEGYKAVEMGGFKPWHDNRKTTNESGVRIDTVSIISGNRNKVDQSSTTKYNSPTKNQKGWVASFIKWTLLIVGGIAALATIYQVYKQYNP